MSIELNHTIVHCSDKKASAEALAGLLGLEVKPQWGPFIAVADAKGAALDFFDGEYGEPGKIGEDREIAPQHYAFLVSEEDFDAILGRIEEAGITYYADEWFQHPGRINTFDGGRGLYWHDRDRHAMEIITRPYKNPDRSFA